MQIKANFTREKLLTGGDAMIEYMIDIANADKADVLTIELAPVQREALDKMVDMTWVSDETLAQAMFDYGFEAMVAWPG